MVRRRSVLSVLVVALATTALAAPSAGAQEVPQMVGNLAPWVPQNNVSPSGNFSIKKARVDCVATDSAAVTARVRCWTQGSDAFSLDSGVVSGSTATINTIADAGAGGVPDVPWGNFSAFCGDAVFTYADGSTRVTDGGCATVDFGTSTVIGFPQ
jgi:hypothetical protein